MVRKPSDRRSVLKLLGTGTIAGLAGCLGDSDDDDGTGDDGTGDDGTGDDGTGDGDIEDRYPEFDPTDAEFPQRVSTLAEHDYHWGNVEIMDELYEPQDEPAYGEAPTTPDDVPDDEKYSPDTILFSRGPVDAQPEAYTDILDPLISNIEDETGLPVDYFEMSDHAAGLEAFRGRRLHLSSVTTGIVAHYVNLTDAYPFVMGVGEERFGYKLWILTRTPDHDLGTGLDELEDMRGEEIVHTHDNSYSGHIMPSALFQDLWDIEPGEDYDIVYSGGHVESARGIDIGDYIGGPVSSHQSVSTPQDIDAVDADTLEVLWSSDPIPSGPFVVDPYLEDDILEGIYAAFKDYDYSGTEMADRWAYAQFVDLDYATHWDTILKVMAINEEEFGEDL